MRRMPSFSTIPVMTTSASKDCPKPHGPVNAVVFFKLFVQLNGLDFFCWNDRDRIVCIQISTLANRVHP